MKTECLEVNRAVWECSREFRKEPFQKRYQEMLVLEPFDEINAEIPEIAKL